MTIQQPPSAFMHDFDHTFSIDLVTTSQDSFKNLKDVTKAQETESTAARIKRLGQMRPEALPSLWRELGLVFSIVMSQILSEYFLSGFAVGLPGILHDLEMSAAQTSWCANIFPLAVASSLLIFGRITDIQGGYLTYLTGLGCLCMWTMISGFSHSGSVLVVCRAFQGLGASAILPSGIKLLGSTYRPGPRKNFIFSIYGACAPGGFFLGILVAGVAGDLLSWRWYFWIGSILTGITIVISYISIPSDTAYTRARRTKMDWTGSITISSGITLFTMGINELSTGRQNLRYALILLCLGLVLLSITAYIEGRAETPLIPSFVFGIPYMRPLLVALFFFYGSVGVFILHTSIYIEEVLGASPLLAVAWYSPMAIGGCFIALVGGCIFHRISGTLLLIFAGTVWVVAPLIFAIAPEDASYWRYILPSMMCATMGIDIAFNVANIFITTSLPQSRQGLAGAIASMIDNLGMSICISIADLVKASTVPSLGPRRSCQAVFWYEVGCSVIVLVIFVVLVRIDRAESRLVEDDNLTT